MARRSTKKNNKIIFSLISLLLLFVVSYYQDDLKIYIAKKTGNYVSYGIEEVPQYHDISYVFIDDNEPAFNETDYKIG